MAKLVWCFLIVWQNRSGALLLFVYDYLIKIHSKIVCPLSVLRRLQLFFYKFFAFKLFQNLNRLSDRSA